MSLRLFAGASRRELTDLKIPGTVAFLDDVASSGHPTSPITAGLFRMGRGEPLVYTYAFDEYKILLEREMSVTEEDGTVHELKPGDMVHFSIGDTVTFSSRSSGLAFYCAQR